VAITPLIFHGKLVTFDPDRPVIEDGALYIGADERIEAVQSRGDPPPSGFEGAARLETRGCVYPGLIDLHNHIAYNVLPLWSPPGRTDPYTSRYQWPRDRSYSDMISKPVGALGALAGKAHLKYVEAKAVVGGVTAIQGSAKMAYPYEGWLVRNVEYETFKTGRKSVYQSALPLRSDAAYADYRAKMEEGAAFLYHVSEGTDAGLIAEYEKLRDEDCLKATFCGIHCTALEGANYLEWAPKGGSVIWSPFSNLWLYRQTTDVLAARERGLRLCLGADWSPSGSKNLLGELKVADLWNRERLDGELADEELCRMATSNPAEALGWGDRLGRLRPGLHGDVLVTTDRSADPYRNLITAIERDVLFVAINGYPFYGTYNLMRSARAENAEPIAVGGLSRRIVMIYPGIKDADMGWAEVLADIAQATRDPIARYLKIERLHKVDRPPPWLQADKPWDDPKVAKKEVSVAVHIPPLDALAPNAAYFNSIARSPLHGQRLDGLRDYYR
jgi:5-methylthioadenosine/S-adenosylhomocysteine deaminase